MVRGVGVPPTPPPLFQQLAHVHMFDDDISYTFLLLPLNLTWVVIFNDVLMNTLKSVLILSVLRKQTYRV